MAGGLSSARTEADAYATGLSLCALHVAGMPVGDQTYRRGVAFWHAVSGRNVAGEDSLVPPPAIFREWISVRAPPVDLHCRDELGSVGDRTNAA